MKKILFLIAIFCALKTNAQNYLITFAGTGASTTVNTVKVENLTLGTAVTINGDDILRLSSTTGVSSIENSQSSQITIYPNPMTLNSVLRVYPPVSGEAIINILDMNGKSVAQIPCFLENSLQEFHLSGISKGLYLISVKGRTYQYSGKLLCNGRAKGAIMIERIVNNQQSGIKTGKENSKGTQATVDMRYYIGDRLKYTGISGIYSTVKIEIPEGNNTIVFNFIACTDGDNNNYPVVEIGTQTWMAENLKTTKYNDGTSIPLVTDGPTWGALSTPGCCWYNNDDLYSIGTYGALYNWYTVNTGKVCPTGWHVPTDVELTTLTTYLGDNAGGELKETGTTHWQSPNFGATNESGFTALPAGLRSDNNGTFSSIGYSSEWWSSIEYDLNQVWTLQLSYDSGSYIGTYEKKSGLSVRCLKDN